MLEHKQSVTRDLTYVEYASKSNSASFPLSTPKWAAASENQQSEYAEKKPQAISAFVFATRIEQFLFYLYPNFQASSLTLWLYRLVCVRPGRKLNSWFSHAMTQIENHWRKWIFPSVYYIYCQQTITKHNMSIIMQNRVSLHIRKQGRWSAARWLCSWTDSLFSLYIWTIFLLLSS